MTAITFDTLKFARRLKDAGVPEKQAEAEALAEVFDLQREELATKGDIRDLEARVSAQLQSELEPVRSDMRLIKWMLALVVIVNVVPVLKSLFT